MACNKNLVKLYSSVRLKLIKVTMTGADFYYSSVVYSFILSNKKSLIVSTLCMYIIR